MSENALSLYVGKWKNGLRRGMLSDEQAVRAVLAIVLIVIQE